MIRTVRLRVYGGPREGAAEVAATFLAVNKYKIALAKIQRRFRKEWRALRTANFSAFAAAEDAYEQAAEALKDAEEKTKQARAEARKGQKAPPEVAAAREKKRAAAEVLKAEREKIDSAALKACTAHLEKEEQDAVKAATDVAGLTSPTAFEARQDLQRAKKTTTDPRGVWVREHDGGGTIAVQVPAVGGSKRLLLDALREADLHPGASPVLRESRIRLVMGRPRFVTDDGRAVGLLAGLRGWLDEEDVEHPGWRESEEAAPYLGHSEEARAAALADLAPLKTWADLRAGRIHDASLRLVDRAEWRASWPEDRGRRGAGAKHPPQPGSRETARHTYGILSIRADRAGVIAQVPVWEVADRFPPAAAQVKQVELHARKLGVDKRGKSRMRYAVLVTIDDPTPRPRQRSGVVAVNVGWRPRIGGGVRCGYFVGDDGDHGEIVVPYEIVQALQKADDLRATWDRLFDLAKARVSRFLATLAEQPEWLIEATKGLPQWRNWRRMERLITAWREHRLPGDEEVFTSLAGPLLDERGRDQAWLPKHLHLLSWEQDQRRCALAQRKHLFQVWGKCLAERYGTLLREDYDLSRQRRRPRVEEGTQRERTPLVHLMNAAAPGELRECLDTAQASRGGQVVKHTVPLATQRCAHCGCEERWDAGASILHTCPACEKTVDQDWQNCVNQRKHWFAQNK